MSARAHTPDTKKVLLWKIGALGDVLMTTPLVRQLRKQLPDARIDYLVGAASRAVIEGNPHLDDVRTFDESILFERQVSRLGRVLALLRGYDTVFVLDKHWVFGWLAKLAGAPRRVGFQRRTAEGWPHTDAAPYGSLRHEIDCYLDLAELAGVQSNGAERGLQLPQSETFTLPRPYVVAINSGGNNPGEASDVRKMPVPLFADLVQALAARTPVVFVGSAPERAGYELLAARQGVHNLCGFTTLRQAWDVLAHADAVYSTDSGLMHMAAAVNRHVTAVFGPTHPLRKCPPGANWVWADADQYDPRYELFGTIPQNRYFRSLTVADILEHAQPSSGAAYCVLEPA